MMRNRKLVLFFNPFFGQSPWAGGRECAEDCEFTDDRRRLPDADAVVFHLPTMPPTQEVWKFPGQQWVLWCLESSVTCPGLDAPALLEHFEVKMTYQQHAEVWCPYFEAADEARLLAPPPPKQDGEAPVAHFQSHAYDRCGRTRYAAELMKRVKVDSYGTVLNNRRLDIPDKGDSTARRVMARYKFALAFENSIAPDYVTDKFFKPLLAGTVPVYRGAPNVAAFAPGEHCFINAAEFAGPAELAVFLNRLAADEDAYRAYFAWKMKGLTEEFRRHLERIRRSAFTRLCDRIRRRDPSRRRGEPCLVRLSTDPESRIERHPAAPNPSGGGSRD